MSENLKYIQDDETKNEQIEANAKKKAKLTKYLLTGGIVLLIGIGIACKCWDGKKFDLLKLSDDELSHFRSKLQDVLLSPSSDQESKLDCIKWINVIDNIIRARNPVDLNTYVYPKGGEHGTNLWKPD